MAEPRNRICINITARTSSEITHNIAKVTRNVKPTSGSTRSPSEATRIERFRKIGGGVITAERTAIQTTSEESAQDFLCHCAMNLVNWKEHFTIITNSEEPQQGALSFMVTWGRSEIASSSLDSLNWLVKELPVSP